MEGKDLRKLGMDPMERLYYERKDHRKRAYEGKRRKALSRSRRQAAGSCHAVTAQEVPCPVRILEGVCQ